MRGRRRRPSGTRYDLGRHLLDIQRGERGWSVQVDGLGDGRWYGSEVEAWQAGVAAAFYLDRFSQAATA